ncbi:MAG: thymidine kinase [Alteromonas naphthalenivorans]|jgi:thymidine kinase
MASKHQKKGQLEVICGSMFSGKSEELIRRIKRAKIAKKNVLVFKPSIDNRTIMTQVASHDGNKFTAIAVDTPLQIPEKISPDIDVIGIDEAQFFSHELVNVVLDLVEDGKTVIIAGLNLDYRAVPFGPMPTLITMADTVTKLSAICIPCGDDAYFTQRIVNGHPAKYDDPVIQIGAEECYQARCRTCFVMDKKPLWQKTL